MIDTGVLVTAGVGVLVTFFSSLITWFFSRKKYSEGVKHDKIENMDSSLDFYKELSESKDAILNKLLKESVDLTNSNINLLHEVRALKIQVSILIQILQTELPSLDLSKYGINLEQESFISKINNDTDTKEEI